jgi:serine/threonine-protein kinase RsbW
LTDDPRPALTADLVPLPPGSALEQELRFSLPSDIACIEEAVELVVRHVEPRFTHHRAVRFNLRVALTEAICNAMLYGSGGDASKAVTVRVAYGRNAVEMEVADEGLGFDPEVLPDPTTPERRIRANGRGIFLIRHLVDEVRFNEKGNAVCMVLRRD